MMKQIQKYKTKDNKIAGILYETENGLVFEKNVMNTRHLFKKDSSYAIDLLIWNDLLSKKVNKIIIHEMDTGKTFSFNPWEVKYRTMDFGYDMQMFVRVKDMTPEN